MDPISQARSRLSKMQKDRRNRNADVNADMLAMWADFANSPTVLFLIIWTGMNLIFSDTTGVFTWFVVGLSIAAYCSVFSHRVFCMSAITVSILASCASYSSFSVCMVAGYVGIGFALVDPHLTDFFMGCLERMESGGGAKAS